MLFYLELTQAKFRRNYPLPVVRLSAIIGRGKIAEPEKAKACFEGFRFGEDNGVAGARATNQG